MQLPTLDCHAHIATSVTPGQVRGLGSAIVFAMTRSPEEAVEATRRYDETILWACGAHPALIAKGMTIDVDQFVRRAKRFAIIGEIGLDRRSGNLSYQEQVLTDLLDALLDEPVLISLHSAGCAGQMTRLIRQHHHPGAIMHWFTGTPSEARELVELGLYFSVNTAMRAEVLDVLPLDRVLPETDFPVARKRTGSKPGDTSGVEQVLGDRFGLTTAEVRRQCYRNLRRIAASSGAIDRMPMRVAELLLSA